MGRTPESKPEARTIQIVLMNSEARTGSASEKAAAARSAAWAGRVERAPRLKT